MWIGSPPVLGHCRPLGSDIGECSIFSAPNMTVWAVAGPIVPRRGATAPHEQPSRRRISRRPIICPSFIHRVRLHPGFAIAAPGSLPDGRGRPRANGLSEAVGHHTRRQNGSGPFGPWATISRPGRIGGSGRDLLRGGSLRRLGLARGNYAPDPAMLSGYRPPRTRPSRADSREGSDGGAHSARPRGIDP